MCLSRTRGTLWRSWLRHCATNRNVLGLIPDGVIGILLRHNPSSRTMALGSTQPLTEMSTRNISKGIKVAGAYGWQCYHLLVPIVLKSGSLNLLEPSRSVQACNGIAFSVSRTHLTESSVVVTTNTAEKSDGHSIWKVKCFRVYAVYYFGIIHKKESPYV